MDDDSITVLIPSRLPQDFITEEQERYLRAELVHHQDNDFGLEQYVM